VQSTQTFFNAARAFAKAACFSADETTLHNWPMFYNAGLFNQFACPLVSGGNIAIGKRFSAKLLEQFWVDIETYRPKYLYLSPTMASSLVKTFRFFDVDKNILQNTKIISTSSILYPVIKSDFHDLFGVYIIPCFGITELGGSFTIGTESSGPFSVGKPIDGVEISIDSGADNEILVTTPYMATGYLNKSGSIDILDSSVPYRTGDLGMLMEDELFVSGRSNESIKKGGEMINLSEIEDMVIASKLCDECLAVGRPDLFWGETYDLVFINKDAEDPIKTRDALNRLFNEALPQTQRPTDIRKVEVIPKTSSGKAIKRLINFESNEA
jgi:acyl-CoA synthetase (AMP-forming)/AMP-acid ligase II